MYLGPEHISKRVFAACLFVLIAVISQNARADGIFPLAPADTSSPRATLSSFLAASQSGIAALHDGRPAHEIFDHFARADSTLDLSEIPASDRDTAGMEASLLLYEVLSRTELPDPSDIPGDFGAHEDAIDVWTVPNTQVSIVRIEADDDPTRYLFSANTIRSVADYYNRVRDLPVQAGFLPGTYEVYVDYPQLTVPYRWVEELPGWARLRIASNPVWKWVVVLLLLSLVLALIPRSLKRLGAVEGSDISKIGSAAGMVILTVGADYLFNNVIGFRFHARTIVSVALRILAVGFAIVFVYLAFRVITDMATRAATGRERISPHFVRLAAHAVAILVLIALAVEAMQFFGLNITPLVAGLGVGGLALALAARPTLENVIGGFVLFADQPVRIGDLCEFGDHVGTVEEIGLRSTRIRRLDERVVTIPNSQFSQLHIVNFSRVRMLLYDTVLQFRYETTPDQLRYLLVEIRRMLVEHPNVATDQLHVRFLAFGAYSLDVRMFSYIETQNLLMYREVVEDLNLRIMEIVARSGTGFAFPSQTAYLARDTGPDRDLTKAAEERVNAWRTERKSFFHDHGAEGAADPPDGATVDNDSDETNEG